MIIDEHRAVLIVFDQYEWMFNRRGAEAHREAPSQKPGLRLRPVEVRAAVARLAQPGGLFHSVSEILLQERLSDDWHPRPSISRPESMITCSPGRVAAALWASS